MVRKRFDSVFDAIADSPEEAASMKEEAERRRGRPVSTNPASVVLPPIRVTPEQSPRYRAAASRAGKSLSAWIKLVADKNA